jgi:hypothetical protein
MTRMFTPLLWTIGCGSPPADAPAPTPLETPAPAEPAPVDRPAATATQAGSHCGLSEAVVFSCATGDGKVLSVCSGPAPGRLQYRFGPPGAPELVFPPSGHAAEFSAGTVQHIRAEGNVLRFDNAGVQYEVTSLVGGGGFSEAEAAANNFTGVYVTTAAGKVWPIPCVGPAADRLAALVTSGSVPPLSP